MEGGTDLISSLIGIVAVFSYDISKRYIYQDVFRGSTLEGMELGTCNFSEGCSTLNAYYDVIQSAGSDTEGLFRGTRYRPWLWCRSRRDSLLSAFMITWQNWIINETKCHRVLKRTCDYFLSRAFLLIFYHSLSLALSFFRTSILLVILLFILGIKRRSSNGTPMQTVEYDKSKKVKIMREWESPLSVHCTLFMLKKLF